MIFSATLLFLAAIVPALLPVYSQKLNKESLKLLLVFAGTYLFAITIIHLLPELFAEAEHMKWIGITVLAGFFFQYVIELFTSGIEHGHVHMHGEHSHNKSKIVSLLIGLSLHSFLEGTILMHGGDHGHGHHSNETMLLGIILHKIPASIALVSFLTCENNNRKLVFVYILIFALASPLGVFVGYLGASGDLGNYSEINFLFAFVCGNFLHISTTIFYETSPEHQWNSRKMVVSLIAALIAVGIEIIG